ncbi:hypothetical protein M514_22767 [Trichuris suis]|uniref:Reverse transcriptase domain-containing protein n=1 Tax=Trichuris suis TaxID=68888 RepID=A0A085N6F4_9BILA|nr:hypothetical protein M514_22767 [Trichuris suis]
MSVKRHPIFDVKDLFTSVPIPYTLNVLQELYADDSLPQRTKLSPFEIVQLASFCMLEGKFFHFQGRFYRQEGGASMGSPLSPVLADVSMERLEGKAFSEGDKNILPRFFKRYVDDIFVIIESGKEEAFLNYLNSLFPNTISFTIEKEMSENGYPSQFLHWVMQETIESSRRVHKKRPSPPKDPTSLLQRFERKDPTARKAFTFFCLLQKRAKPSLTATD